MIQLETNVNIVNKFINKNPAIQRNILNYMHREAENLL